MNFKTLIAAGVLCFALASCSSSKTVLPYFTDISVGTGTFPSMEYMPRIQPTDELFISVTSKTPEVATIYNLPFANPSEADAYAQTSTPRQQTYLVNSQGDIDFPVLGTIHVEGMTVEQLKEYIIKRVSSDIKDPQVNVAIVNFDVVVAGEVVNPRSVHISGPRMTVLEALAQAGDLTEYGERSNVLIIREEKGERVYAHLDLNNSDVLTSPYYYLKQNDYIYVAPNKVRQANSKYNQNNAFKLSIISTVVSAASVIASLVIALTVK